MARQRNLCRVLFAADAYDRTFMRKLLSPASPPPSDFYRAGVRRYQVRGLLHVGSGAIAPL
jgi:hypothetical protein